MVEQSELWAKKVPVRQLESYELIISINANDC